MLKKILARAISSDLLAGLAIASAILTHQYFVAGIIVLMLVGGVALERYAARNASSVLAALAKRTPNVAHRREGTRTQDVSLDDVRVGNALVVLPHEICPVDGVVVEGRGSMDESYLTGEPFHISKTPGTQVLSGAVNGEGVLLIRAEKLPVDSRYARIMQVMQESQQARPRMRRVAERLGAWYTPAAVLVAALAAIGAHDAHRFVAVLVIATPCPLLISIPVAVIAAISVSARRSIIVRDPAILEHVSRCSTLILDKTGTLTYGRPMLSDITCAPGVDRTEALAFAASLEQYSKHPLAGAVLDAAQREGAPLKTTSHISERPGEGLRGIVNGRHVKLAGRGRHTTLDLPAPRPGLECLLFINDAFAAVFHFLDEPRHEGKAFVAHLGPKHEIHKVVLLTGDREMEARHLADAVGIAEVHASKSPEDKLAIVKAETGAAKTIFVGDGINDAPAMLAATVGVAFGHGSDIITEAAGAVILDPSLQKIDELMHIGRRMRVIALESAMGGMALSLVGMVAAAAGFLPPIAGALAQEAIDVLAVLNAIRVAIPVRASSDFTADTVERSHETSSMVPGMRGGAIGR